MKDIKDPVRFDAEAAILLLQIKSYFEHFTDDPTVLNLITLAKIYGFWGRPYNP